MKVWITNKDKNVCKNCKHFYPHYCMNPVGRLIEVGVGHCGYPRIKDKEAYDSCKYFERRSEITW